MYPGCNFSVAFLQKYEGLLLQQKSVCGICKKLPAEGRRLVVDHSHITNEVRGLLCDGCNVTIAIFDNPILLAAAKEYLKIT